MAAVGSCARDLGGKEFNGGPVHTRGERLELRASRQQQQNPAPALKGPQAPALQRGLWRPRNPSPTQAWQGEEGKYPRLTSLSSNSRACRQHCPFVSRNQDGRPGSCTPLRLAGGAPQTHQSNRTVILESGRQRRVRGRAERLKDREPNGKLDPESAAPPAGKEAGSETHGHCGHTECPARSQRIKDVPGHSWAGRSVCRSGHVLPLFLLLPCAPPSPLQGELPRSPNAAPSLEQGQLRGLRLGSPQDGRGPRGLGWCQRH